MAAVAGFATFSALGTVLDGLADGLLDADPMVFLGDAGSGLVDAGMADGMCLVRNLILPLRVRNNLLVLQHELVFAVAVVSGYQAVVSTCAAEPALLGAIATRRVHARLEIVANLVKAFL